MMKRCLLRLLPLCCISVLHFLVSSLLSKEQAQQVKVVMVSVDPERDSTTVMQQYLQAFDGNFIGITGTVEQIRQMARSFNVFFRKVPLGKESVRKEGTFPSYTMEHSSQIFVFDKKGEARWFYYGDAPAEFIASDIRLLLKESY